MAMTADRFSWYNVAGWVTATYRSYSTWAPSSSSNYIRRTSIDGGHLVNYDYGSSSGINDYLSRIQKVVDGSDSSVSAEYTYLGGGNNAVRLDFAQPQVMLDLWGGTSGTFDGLDLFGRIVDQRWKYYGSTPVDLDRYQYGYDRNSNRLWKQNMVKTTDFDEQYAVDDINRLTQMKRGTLNGSHVIPGTPGKQENWTLDALGNWTGFSMATGPTTDLDQTRTNNKVNEITDITTTFGTDRATPGYDAAGNMTAFLKPSDLTANLTAVYDAWNRLVAVKDGTNYVARYAYDGMTRRTVKQAYDSSGTLTETRHYYFSDQWQIVREMVSGSTAALYIWGLRYVDELLVRYDPTYGRKYAMQDANFNCTSICDDASTGTVDERYQYDPYAGNRIILDSSWNVIADLPPKT